MPKSAHRAMTPLEWALLVALSLMWGASFFFVAIALEELSPITVVTLRLTIAALILFIILSAKGMRLPTDGQSWRDFVIMGFLNCVIPFTLIAWGQSHIGSGLASILNGTAPIFTVLAAHFFAANEGMTPARIAGVSIGFGGVVITIGPSALAGFGNEILAQLALLGAATGYAVSVIFALRFSRRGIAPITVASGQMIAASIMMLPIMWIVDRPFPLSLPSTDVIAAILGLAVFSTVIAYLIYYRILSTAGSVNLILVTFLIPVSAILLGVSFLGEVLLPHQILGMLVIGIGLAVIDGRLMKRIKRVPTAPESR